ncbi:MAG TPA: hypothetical protein VLI90_08965 [Tepidisphaeraceae bacterium]|nr:hypothetical protein [Tepidisphaeraceae bacterium]
MTDEPLPVIALEYRQGDEQTPWFAVVRLLSILCIISNAVVAFSSIYYSWYYLDLDHRAAYVQLGYSSSWLLCSSTILLLSGLTSVCLVIGGWGCIKRKERWRRATVRAAWVKVLLIAVQVVMTVGFYASRASQMDTAQAVIQLVTREVSGSVLLTIATAVILARPEVKRAFAASAAPITQ